MKSLIVRFVREEEGQDLIEYALLGVIDRGCWNRRGRPCGVRTLP